MKTLPSAIALLFTLACLPAHSVEVTGKLGVEGLYFSDEAPLSDQHKFYGSVSVEPEFYQAINDNSELKAKLFYRYDAHGISRTHADVRELMYYYFTDDWEIHAGVGKVFWGVTESRHLVDIINQVDNIEILDDEQRLGQAMLQAKFIKDWGTIDLFVLPHFREVEFGGDDLRPNSGIQILDPIYQNKRKDKHVDYAMRWSHSIDNLDIGVSYFNGTQRSPVLTTVLSDGQPKLQPVYVQSKSFGIDAQYILDDWLLKFEGMHRQSHNYSAITGFKDYNSNAVVAGFEYTIYGINDSTHDIGLIGEYLFDQWKETTPFQRDWMSGVRWVWNDEQSTELLFGSIVDLDDGTQTWQLEASRRIDDAWKASTTARWTNKIDESNLFFNQLNNQDQISIKLDYYF